MAKSLVELSKDKLENEVIDFLKGLNAVGDISCDTYSEVFYYLTSRMDKMYTLGKLEGSKEPLCTHGDLLTMEDFVKGVRLGYIPDYDGEGYYSDGKYEYKLLVDLRCIDTSFSHVMWYNH